MVDLCSFNERIPRMLNQHRSAIIISIILVTASSCSNSNDVYRYCSSHSGAEFLLDFEDKTLRMGSRGSLDQVYPIISCGKGIRSCFMSEIDFLNPHIENERANPNLISQNQTERGIEVELRYERKMTRYVMSNNQDMPSYFIITTDGQKDKFTRC